uniref:Uncharacterized protein n=1 Tax=Tanacetum cinerariifolium TaxID=118510 RepID=A0A6L2L5P4_TANCI|nr:hypothetical protein [Tanacetum cinerariifolium]
MPTKIELILEQSQQGVSNDVLVSIEGVEESKRNVWIKGENKAALHTLKAETGSIHMLRFSPRLGSKMKYVFGRSRSKDESLSSLMCSLCSGLRVSLSNKRRLVAELKALGDSEGATKCLEHMRVIVDHDAVTLGELEALLACA